jgi:hypothetical protein
MIFGLEGSGPYNSKSPLDEDTVQIKSYHFVSSSTPSTATLTVKASLASDVVSMPVDLVLNGLMVCIYFLKLKFISYCVKPTFMFFSATGRSWISVAEYQCEYTGWKLGSCQGFMQENYIFLCSPILFRHCVVPSHKYRL